MTVATASPRSNGKGQTSTTRSLKDQLLAWGFISPSGLLLLVFLVLPFLLAFYFSFTNQRLITNPNVPTQFTGLSNYERLLSDTTFHRGLLNNFLFALIVVPIQTSFALLLAILVNQKIRSVNVFRSLYFIPVVVPMVVVSVIWTFLYNPGEGTINAFFSLFGLGPYNWLGDTKLAFPAIMVLSIWQGVGFQMVIYLAGLQEIPDYLYEAAQIDGASKIQQFFNITLPSLRNTTIFVVISTTILAFKLFVQVDVMTRGGPQDATMTTVLHAVNVGFRQLQVGRASAIVVVFFVIVLFVSLLQRVFLQEERSVN
jgi:multiple sugar transport system permease protein